MPAILRSIHRGAAVMARLRERVRGRGSEVHGAGLVYALAVARTGGGGGEIAKTVLPIKRPRGLRSSHVSNPSTVMVHLVRDGPNGANLLAVD